MALVRGRPNEWAAINGEWRRTDAARGAAPPPLVDSMLAAWTDILSPRSARSRRRPSRCPAGADATRLGGSEGPAVLPGCRGVRHCGPAGPGAGDSLGVRWRGQGHRDAPRRCADMHSAWRLRSPSTVPRTRSGTWRADTAFDGQPVDCEICFPLAAGRAYDAAGNRDSGS